MDVRRAAAFSLTALLSCPTLTLAQATAGEGRMLERRGRYEEAEATYRAVAKDDPSNPAAWFGLERTLNNQGRLESILPLLDSTLDSTPDLGFLHELRLRVWTNLHEPDSMTATARRWVERFPDSHQPYRQWAFALSSVGNVSEALAVLDEARSVFGAGVLSPEVATLLGTAGRWADAAGEWGTAITRDRENLAAAGMDLRQVPVSERESVLAVIASSENQLAVRQLGAELLVAWDRPEDGWELLQDALPADPDAAAAELRFFADRVARIQTPVAARVRALALERLADITVTMESEQARLDAAQAYADAGDFAGARRMLGGLLDVNEGIPADAGAAMVTLIRITAESGQIEAAQERLELWEARLKPSDAQGLRERIAWAWIMSGETGRAKETLQGDSSLAAAAILGWAALFDGQLRQATAFFLAAGPFAQSREQATRRTAALALVQGVEPDTVVELGRAMLSLERADTSSALDVFEKIARDLPADGGRCPVLAFAGELARQNGNLVRAEALLHEALDADSLSPSAPAAEYALASVLADRGDAEAAVQQLEHMILSFPGSALVPEARRLLDQVRGAIPRQ